MFMLRRIINGLTDIVYPRTCLVCKNKLTAASPQDSLVCAACWNNIKRNPPPFCHSCGRNLNWNNFAKNICPACTRKKVHFDRAFSPCPYTGVIKELIHEFKYNGKDYLAGLLCRLMTEFIREYNLPMDCLDSIVPIPLHKTRLRQREFNQAELLAKHISSEFDKEVLSDILKRHRDTKTQTELAQIERFANVKGSFSITKADPIRGKNILLIDDVLTTAATSSEAALVLKNAGAKIVFVLTLAN